MNAFIQASNQSTLWKVLNNVAQVQQYFLGAPPGVKEKWFQTHIGQIYQMYYGKQEALQSLNKKAIDIMLGSLAPRQQSVPLQSGPLQQHAVPLQSAHVPLQSVPLQPHAVQLQSAHVPLPGQAIRETTMDEFSRRQAEYDAMVNKKTPVANFSEPIKDDAILDLNSAVEQYKKAREILPRETFVSQAVEPSVLSDDQIQLQVEELPSVDNISREPSDSETTVLSRMPLASRETQFPLEKKQVQWSNTNQEHDHFETRILKALANIEKDITEIKAFIAGTLNSNQ